MLRSSTLRYSSSCGLKLGTAPKGYTKWLPLAFSSMREVRTRSADIELSKGTSSGSSSGSASGSALRSVKVSLSNEDAIDFKKIGKGGRNIWTKYLYIISRFQNTRFTHEAASGVALSGDLAPVPAIDDDESVDTGYLIPVFLAKLFDNFDGVRTEEIILNPMDDPEVQYTSVRAMSKDKLVELRARIPTNENSDIRSAILEGVDLTPLYIDERSDDDGVADFHSAVGTSAFINNSYVRFIIYDSPHELRPPRNDDPLAQSRRQKENLEPSLSEQVGTFSVFPVVLCSPSFIKNFTFRVPPPPPTCAADDKELWIMPNDWKIMTRIIDAEINIIYRIGNSDNAYVQWLPYLTTVGVQSDTVRAFLQASIDTFTSTDSESLPVLIQFKFPTSNPIMYPY